MVTADGMTQLCLEVEDTGVGIAQDELENVFDAFVQTQSGQQSKVGTGLGMPISRRFARLMGGDLRVKSQLDVGTVFRFKVPIQIVDAADVEAPRPVRRVVGLAPGQPRYRLLLTEDVDASRKLLLQLLQPLGFELREAADGQRALEIWKEWRPHLIFMDLRMPLLDGRQATTQIKSTQQGQETVIVALTASAFEEERREILQAGFDDFVRKPFRESDLFEVLEKHLGVRFVYEAIDRSLDIAPDAALSLAAMQPAWLSDLRQATLACDVAWIETLIQQIQDQDPDLAAALRALAHDFEYDQITALIDAV
jgi:CheY-like chemotaxis protein